MSNRFIQVRIDVAYEQADAVQLNDIATGIYQSLEREIGNGMLTNGAPEVVVDSYQVSVQHLRSAAPKGPPESPC